MPRRDLPTQPARWQPRLARGRWCASLPPSGQTQRLALAVPQTWPTGTTVFTRGDANSGLYAVLDGAIRIGAADASGEREAVLGLLGPAQWFGEIACLDGGVRTHDAHAKVASTGLLVPLAALQAWLQEEPLLWRHLGQLLAEKVRALFTGLEELSLLSPPQRVARRLLAMAQGHGMLVPGAALREVAVNQDQLGAMLSLSRQTVSEVLRDFEARGLVRRGYGVVALLDPAGLAALGQAPAAP